MLKLKALFPFAMFVLAAATEGAPAADVAPAAEKPAPAPKDIQNGVTRPKAGTKTGNVWDTADKISSENQRPALREEVMEACTKAGINKGTIATQYARWTEYHGVTKEQRKAVRDTAREAAEATAKAEADAAAAATAAATAPEVMDAQETIADAQLAEAVEGDESDTE